MDAKYETIINGIQNLINTTIQCENENGRRCINTDDLNEFETWIDMLSDLRALAKMNPTSSKQLAAPAVSVALVDNKFMKWLAKEAPELCESLYGCIQEYETNER